MSIWCGIHPKSVIYMIHFPHNQDAWIWEPRGGSRFMVPLTVSPNDPLANFGCPSTATLSSAGLEVLVSQGIMFPPRETYQNELDVKTAIFISACHWTNRQNVGDYIDWCVWSSSTGEMWQTMGQRSLCLYPRDYLEMPLTILCPRLKFIGILEQYWQDSQGVISPQEWRIESFCTQ